MILIPISLLLLCVTTLGATLPEFQTYLRDRAQADRACRNHAEEFVDLYRSIQTANRQLQLLRLRCKLAQANPTAAAAATVELGPLSQAIAIEQDVNEQIVQTRAQLINDTGPVTPTTDRFVPGAEQVFPGAEQVFPGAERVIPGAEQVIHFKPGFRQTSVTPLRRNLAGACGIVGDLKIPCEGQILVGHESEIAGFAIACAQSQVSWYYNSQKPVGLP